MRASTTLPDRPLVCLDESSKQLIAETRVPIPMKPGRPARCDYAYERNGTANLFMMFAPLEGWRHAKADWHSTTDNARITQAPVPVNLMKHPTQGGGFGDSLSSGCHGAICGQSNPSYLPTRTFRRLCGKTPLPARCTVMSAILVPSLQPGSVSDRRPASTAMMPQTRCGEPQFGPSCRCCLPH